MQGSMIIGLFFILLVRVINQDYQIRQKNIYKSALNDKQSYKINLDNFDVAFGVRFKSSDNVLSIHDVNISRYLNITFNQYDQDFNMTVNNKPDMDTLARKNTII